MMAGKCKANDEMTGAQRLMSQWVMQDDAMMMQSAVRQPGDLVTMQMMMIDVNDGWRRQQRQQQQATVMTKRMMGRMTDGDPE